MAASGRIGVISDTHLGRTTGLPEVLLRAFEGVEAILHAGDVTDVEALEPLLSLARVYVVAGNVDPPAVGARCGWRRALRWRGWRFGLVHGDAGPGRTTPDRAVNAFAIPPPAWEDIPSTVSPRKGKAPAPWPRSTVAVPLGLPEGVTLPTPVAPAFDCIVFGHSHIPTCRLQDGVLLLNPGSPTDRRSQPRGSFALLEASEKEGLLVRFYYV
jgi:uncharacterized protein